ncbi:MAG: hypothetical protein AAB400_02415 [Patescibacteria group bacterium]
MQKILINIKTEKEVKRNAQTLAKELGLSLSDVINAALRNFIRTREVYFSSIPRMTPELERIIGRVEEDIKKKRNISKTFTSLKDMNVYLDSLRSV